MTRKIKFAALLAIVSLATAVAEDTIQTDEQQATQDSAETVQLLPQRPPHQGVAENIFGGHSWYTPPPPPPRPQRKVETVPKAPVAPPLPFILLGSYEQEGTPTTYFLLKGDRVYNVIAGDVIEDTYTVDGDIDGSLLFTYLPLQTSQGIRLGEPK